MFIIFWRIHDMALVVRRGASDFALDVLIWRSVVCCVVFVPRKTRAASVTRVFAAEATGSTHKARPYTARIPHRAAAIANMSDIRENGCPINVGPFNIRAGANEQI